MDTELNKLLARCTKTQATTSAEFLKGHLRRLAIGNWLVIGVTSVIIGICLIMMGFIANRVFDIIYKKFMANSDTGDISDTFDTNPDNYSFRPSASDAMGVTPEYVMLQYSMDRLKNEYGGYNKGRLADAVAQGVTSAPDDLVDEGILSRANDNYKYVKKDKEAVVMLDDE